MSWLAHFFGLDNLSGPFYGWWSGAGSDIGEITIIGAAIAVFRAHNCHVDGCWKIGKHPVDGTAFRTCKKHHPAVPDKVTSDTIGTAHQNQTIRKARQ